MKKQNKIGGFIEKAMKFTEEHQREIMLGGAIAGTVVTAVMSFKAGLKADKILEEQRAKMDAIEIGKPDKNGVEIKTDEELAIAKKDITIETVKRMAPIVAPPALAATGTIISVVAGYKVASAQIATLSALYSMVEKGRTEYQDKLTELLGEKKATAVTDAVNQDKVNENPPKHDTIISTGRGSVLCYDDYSGRYFYSDPESIRKVVNDINLELNDVMFVSLNEFYDGLGLENIKLGDDLGFAIEDGHLKVSWSATLTKDNVPCLVLNYDVSPKYGYGDLGGPRYYR